MADWFAWGSIGAAFLWLLWWGRCAHVTKVQRSELIDAVSEESLRRVRSKDLGEQLTWETPFAAIKPTNTHDRHLWRNMTFRDPYTIYPKYIRRLVGK